MFTYHSLVRILLLIVTSVAGALVLRYLFFAFLRWNSRTGFISHLVGIRKYIQNSLLAFLSSGIILLSIPFLKLSAIVRERLEHVFQIITIMAGAWLLIRIVQLVKHILLQNAVIDVKDNLHARREHTRYQVFARVAEVFVVLIGVGLVFMTFESVQKVGVSLLASAGVIGVILGFAAQKALGSLFAGLQVAIAQPIRVDDVLIVEGEWGTVEEIHLTYIVLKLWDKRRLVVPTSHFLEKPFQNWTRTTAELLGSIELFVDYKMPVDAIRTKLDQILEQTDLWDKQTKVVQVTDMTDRAMKIRILVSAEDSGTLWNLRVYVREVLVTFLQKEYPDMLPKVRIEEWEVE